MGIMIQICEDEIEDLATDMEVLLHAGGRIMSNIERLKEGSDKGYGRRRPSVYRRVEDEDDEETPVTSRRGRYM